MIDEGHSDDNGRKSLLQITFTCVCVEVGWDGMGVGEVEEAISHAR